MTTTIRRLIPTGSFWPACETVADQAQADARAAQSACEFCGQRQAQMCRSRWQLHFTACGVVCSSVDVFLCEPCSQRGTASYPTPALCQEPSAHHSPQTAGFYVCAQCGRWICTGCYTSLVNDVCKTCHVTMLRQLYQAELHRLTVLGPSVCNIIGDFILAYARRYGNDDVS